MGQLNATFFFQKPAEKNVHGLAQKKYTKSQQEHALFQFHVV